jgi:hypothetical protein
MPLRESVGRVMADFERFGLDLLDPKKTGDLAAFRVLDLSAVLDRIRGLKFRQADDSMTIPAT